MMLRTMNKDLSFSARHEGGSTRFTAFTASHIALGSLLQRSKDYGNNLETFRPGHADDTYLHKYGLRDPRGRWPGVCPAEEDSAAD